MSDDLQRCIDLLQKMIRTPSLPGSGNRPDFQPAISRDQMTEQLVGPPVSVAIDGKPLAKASVGLRSPDRRNRGRDVETDKDGKFAFAHLPPGKYGVRGIPTLLVFKGGQVASQKVGAAPGMVDGSFGKNMDYGPFVVHVFHQEQRAFYQLERLWGDRPRVAWEPLMPRPETA